MRMIDLDEVDWSKCPKEVIDMTSISTVRQFLDSQKQYVAVPIISTNNPKIKAAATVTSMHFNQAIASMYPLMIEIMKDAQETGGPK